MAKNDNFRVNLGGIIRLLSDHLYGGPEVYIRELLQNAVDAITARRHHEAAHQGLIRFESIGADSAPTLTVEDNGVGLTEAEVHQFLATIGQSSKSGELSRDDFIGQFGIGLLSGFVVSDEITVISKSIRDDSPPVEWKGRSDGTYTVRTLSREFSPGTRVFLHPKEGKEEFFQRATVDRLTRHFGRHLPHTIEVGGEGDTRQINETPPWREAYRNPHEQRDALLEYGRKAFDVDFSDAVPLRSERGEVDGAAYILPHAASPASAQKHQVYLKNMLLAETVEGLMPKWAFFVKCVVNADRLRPNAARDSFYKDDALRETRDELGACLRNYLVELGRNDRPRLERIIQMHYLPIKALAIEDDEFFRLFIDWLPFETSLGTTTLGDHCRDFSKIRYVRDVDQFRQISGVAAAQNICVFNGGYSYDTDLLERVGDAFPGRTVEQVDAEDLVQDFEELTIEEHEEVFDLIRLADLVLQEYKCGAEARKFAPTDLPTLYTSSESATFMRSIDQSKEEVDNMWGGILDNVAAAADAGGYARLVLNYRNPLIRKLAGLGEKPLLERIIRILYLQALLLGHYPLSSRERTILGDGLLGLIDHFVK